MNSMPSLRYKEVADWFRKPLAGEKAPGDKADIWLLWMKQGKRGGKELVEKYGAKSVVTTPIVEPEIGPVAPPRMKTALELELEEVDRIVNDA